MTFFFVYTASNIIACIYHTNLYASASPQIPRSEHAKLIAQQPNLRLCKFMFYKIAQKMQVKTRAWHFFLIYIASDIIVYLYQTNLQLDWSTISGKVIKLARVLHSIRYVMPHIHVITTTWGSVLDCT